MIARLLAINALLLVLYMSVCFLVARLRRRIDTVDIAWGIGFVLVAWSVALQQPTNRSLLVAGLISIWGVRLANHIYQRHKRHGNDPRYTELSRKWKGNFWLRAYISIFLLQAALIWMVSLPIVFASQPQLVGWGWLSLAGSLVWLIGFGLEATADSQLSRFLGSKNHPKILQTGLWRYSRHPNYFGELTQWWGIGLIALQTSYGWLGLLGPLTLSMLIIFVSGIPPIEKSRQDDADYQAYKRLTSPLIPLPRRRTGI